MTARTVFALVLTIGLLAPVSAQIVVTGYLTTQSEPVDVDSVRFEYGVSVVWFNTAGWHCDPMDTTDFTFPPFANFPATIQLAGNFMGLPFLQQLYRPVRDTWYQFDPPHDQTSAMFTAPSAVLEPGRTSPVPFLSITPAIVRDAATIVTPGNGALEIFGPTGQPVLRLAPAPSTFRWNGTAADGRLLPEGVYFCRLSSEAGVALRKVLVAR